MAIAAEWLETTAQESQWRACRILPSLFPMVRSMTPYDLPFPQHGVPNAPLVICRISIKCKTSATTWH